ncbi:Gypsy retrotransposon integrase-like protein 1, partial [Mucuna pruriens]
MALVGGWSIQPDRKWGQSNIGRTKWSASNNQAEYEALLAEIRLTKELEAKTLTAKSDSKLITGQNERVDLLSKLTTSQKRGVQRSVIHESIGRLTIEEPDVGCTEEQTTWMSPLIAYPSDEILPKDPAVAEKLIKDATRYIIIEGELYRRCFSFTLLRYIEGEEARYVIKEVHEGLCGSHIGGRALASKISRTSYYCPTLKDDCLNYVKRCDKCQRFVEVSNAPSEQLHSITSPWSFHKLGVDILGPFPPAQRQVKYLIVVVDYFTKWIEAKPVATISVERIKRFYWKKIICRFGLPAEIVSNNETQFTSRHEEKHLRRTTKKVPFRHEDKDLQKTAKRILSMHKDIDLRRTAKKSLLGMKKKTCEGWPKRSPPSTKKKTCELGQIGLVQARKEKDL